MSDHLDGLTAQNDPRLDISDLYLFRGTSGLTCVMDTNPGGEDGFHPEAVYEFKFDIDQDAQEEATLRVTFDESDRRGRQNATLTLLTGPDACDRDADGLVLARTSTGRETTGMGGIRFWAGPAGDPFYIEPTVLSAVRTSVLEGTRLDLSDFEPGHAHNRFAGDNVQAIVVEIPDQLLQGLTVGFWGAIAIPTDDSHAWRQTDRAGIPLLSTLFGFNTSDAYGAAHPTGDATTWGPTIQHLIRRAVEADGYRGDAGAYAIEQRELLTPDMLRYRIGSPARFTDGHRNGRNFTENVAEEMFELVLHRAVDMGLDAESATGRLRRDFPYLSKPT